jgi:hypothetical protein
LWEVKEVLQRRKMLVVKIGSCGKRPFTGKEEKKGYRQIQSASLPSSLLSPSQITKQ